MTTTLTEVGFRANWESMKASQVSGLLVGYEANGDTVTTYDLTKDCANPELASNLFLDGWVGGSIGHAGSFSPDGTIYYASSMYTGEVFAIDLATPKEPKVITNEFEAGAHDLFVGKDEPAAVAGGAGLPRGLPLPTRAGKLSDAKLPVARKLARPVRGYGV